VKIAIVGGTGAFGRALAARWHRLDLDVTIGSRDRERAERQAAVIGVRGAANADAVRDADFVVLAVESRATVATARDLADAIEDAPVLCVASDLRFTKNGVLPGRSEGSLAEEVETLVRGPVVSGFQAIPAAQLARPEPLDEDVLVCGDHHDSKRLALELAQPLICGRAIDAGPLANARALEGMTAVILHVNRTYKVVAGLRLTGFE
jgi:8-hydroxy-5-deazaflavin:NADPH oxidoreductase